MENQCSSIHHHPPPPPSSSLFSSTLDNNSNRSSKSMRLQNTLSELEWKIERILEVVEDNGDTFAQRAQMYYQKRPELIQMLSDLRKSYRAIADNLVMIIRSESINIPTTTSSDYFCCSGHLMVFDHHHHHQPNFDDITITAAAGDDEEKEKVISDNNNNNNNDVIDDHQDQYPVIPCDCDEEKGGGGGGGGWDELLAQVTELMEENTSKQAELVRRYAKKNEDMKLLIMENRRLREMLSQFKNIEANNKRSSSQPKWKPRHFFRKLLP